MAYRAASDRLFIPEMRRSPLGVGQMFCALAGHGALGVAPFGVDSLDPGQPEHAELVDGYRLLRAYAELRAEHPEARSAGFVLDANHPSTRIELDGWTVQIDTGDPSGLSAPTYPAYGCVLQTGADTLVIIGRRFSASFRTSDPAKAGIDRAAELSYDGGQWVVTRELNGDETGSGAVLRLTGLGEQTPAIFPIPFDLRRTGLVAVTLYRY